MSLSRCGSARRASSIRTRTARDYCACSMPERFQRSTGTASKKRSSDSVGAQLFQEAAVFVCVFGLSIVVVRVAPEAGAVPVGTGETFIWYFLATFAAATALLILLIR